MPFLEQVTIKRKLMWIIMLTSSAALVAACIAFIVFEVVMFRRSMTRDLGTLGQLIADYSTAAVDFEDAPEGAEILRALRVKPNIVTAVIFKNGQPFVVYPPATSSGISPERPWPTGARFHGGYLEHFQPVIANNEVIGTVYLKSDLGDLYGRLQQYIWVAAIVLILSSALALLLSARLQRLISQPILHLALTTRAVSRDRNYTLRAVKQSSDELGELIDAFNEMLGQIQLRDAALQRGRDELEKRVEERTRELQDEIAERKQTEEKLKKIATKLERSNRELQDFAYVASHDLQEPLRKVQAFGDRLVSKYASIFNEEARDFVQRMQVAANRMQNLIQDLLAFSRITTQAQPFGRVDLQRIVREVLSDLEVRLQQTEGVVQVERLPEIEADAVQMRQLFQNLISNALKFHNPGTPPIVRIWARVLPAGVGSENSGDLCEINVEDKGIGFDDRYRERIFAVFQRLHGRQTYEGTGIGLAICRKIVERHGGTITAHGTPGQGALFTVALPVAQLKPEIE